MNYIIRNSIGETQHIRVLLVNQINGYLLCINEFLMPNSWFKNCYKILNLIM